MINFTVPLFLTLKLSFVTMAFLFIIGIPFAYWLAFSGFRWKFFVESVVALPLVLPPTVLGFYLLMTIGGNSFIGQWYEGVFHKPLAFSFQGLVLGSFLYSLPFAVQPLRPHGHWADLVSIPFSMLYCRCLAMESLPDVYFLLRIPLANLESCS